LICAGNCYYVGCLAATPVGPVPAGVYYCRQLVMVMVARDHGTGSDQFN